MTGKPLGKIIGKTAVQFLLGTSFLSALLFLAAGTTNYWQVWASVPSLMLPMSLSGLIFTVQGSGILERRRLKWGSLTPERKIYMSFVYIAELSLLAVPALDRRFGWSHMPPGASAAGCALLVLANVVWIVSKTANPYAGSAITIYEGHKLCETGPYALIRHPNYAGDLLLNLGLPLALGSWYTLLVFAAIIPAQVYMTLDEERFLRDNLPGYTEYTRKVRWRIIPGIW